MTRIKTKGIDMFQRVVTFFEKQSFGVCTYLADKLNISISKIRLFFIYSSFLAVGFPIIFYVLAALVLDVRHYIKKIRLRIWDV
ncbi:MAG TPA: PspC domain-containing protein [Pedobacter sp.]|jgi:phage shock protein C|nr:PspC domain-containing protein [Pedobacter sp.]